MKNFLREIFEYTYHFNELVINSIIENTIVPVPQKSLLLLNHTINAQEIWNARINGSTCNTGVWEMRPVDTLKNINSNNYKNSVDIVNSLDLTKEIHYTNSRGEGYKNTIQDMLFHIVNHSTYHRGQIATDFKIAGITPLVSDYIFYRREQL